MAEDQREAVALKVVEYFFLIEKALFAILPRHENKDKQGLQ